MANSKADVEVFVGTVCLFKETINRIMSCESDQFISGNVSVPFREDRPETVRLVGLYSHPRRL